jgi:hypothetical protein
MRTADEGLGLSVIAYAAIMLAGLALVIGPVIWSNSGTAYENPALSGGTSSSAPLYSGVHGKRTFPVALLKHPTIVDPAVLAKVNEAAEPAKPARAASAPAHRRYAEARPQEAAPPASRRGGPASFFFSLFGG